MSLQATTPRLVLASASAARLALLRGAGLNVEARPAAVDEAAVKVSAQAGGHSAEDAAMLLADMKAARIASADPDALVIGADQILVCGAHWFDKPASRPAAREQLAALRGRTHRLATAVLCRRGEQIVWQHVASPLLTMRAFSPAFLDTYIDAEADALQATVGAYRLEALGVHLFERVQGEHAAILGLPLLPLLAYLRQAGLLLA